MPKSAQLAILNGPNLNLLGTREPDVYGSWTLADIEALCSVTAAELGYDVEFFQSNYEGELVEAIHRAGTQSAGIVINPAAYTHTSVAIADALAAVALPVVEVHLSNIATREAFRHHSYVSAQATAVISGAGSNGYRFAIEHLASVLNSH